MQLAPAPLLLVSDVPLFTRPPLKSVVDNDTIRPLFAGAIGVAAAALIAGFFASNYRLDKKMNAVTE
jgi:hypothetical protein